MRRDGRGSRDRRDRRDAQTMIPRVLPSRQSRVSRGAIVPKWFSRSLLG